MSKNADVVTIFVGFCFLDGSVSSVICLTCFRGLHQGQFSRVILRETEREFGWVVFAWEIREENFDLICFWISPQNVHNNKNVVTVCSSSPP